MNEKRINIGEIEIQVKEYINNGPSIIFLHFGGANLKMWDGVIPHFKETFHVLLVDMKGHGKSAKPKVGYHIDQMAKEIILVMDKLGMQQAHVVGSSLGAEVGLSMAANFPDHILSLVCDGALFSQFGPYGLWEGTEEEFNQYSAELIEKSRTQPPKEYASIDAFVEANREGLEQMGWWNDILESVYRRGNHQLENGRYIGSWGIVNEDYTKHFLKTKFEDYYARVKCPVMLIPDAVPGQNEREKEVMQGLFKLLEHGKIEYVDGWVHPFGWTIDPTGGSKAVLNFIETLD